MLVRRVLWFLGALAGVVLAAGVSYAASSLSTQRVGLSAEPPSAGADLAPRATATPKARPRRTATPKPKPTPEAARDTAPRADDRPGPDGRAHRRRPRRRAGGLRGGGKGPRPPGGRLAGNAGGPEL